MMAGGRRVCQNRGRGKSGILATFGIQVRELEGKAVMEERAENALTHNQHSSDAHSVHRN
jgi:hypothetical protein